LVFPNVIDCSDDPQGQVGWFKRSLDICEKHAVKSDGKWMWCQSKVLFLLGSTNFKLWQVQGFQTSVAGNKDTAEVEAMICDADRFLTRCLQIMSKISAKDSARTVSRGALWNLVGMAHACLGDVALGRQNISQALSCYKEALAIDEYVSGHGEEAETIRTRMVALAK
jgi:hypothetical protein